jgi:hypothetical protein
VNIEECYQFLDVKPGARLDEINESFRLLVKVWQPDRFAHSPRLQARAQEKLKEIQAAKTLLDEYLAAGNEPLRRSDSAPPAPYKPVVQTVGGPEGEAERKRQDAERRKQAKERLRQDRAREQQERRQREQAAATEQARLAKDQRFRKEKQKRVQRETEKLARKQISRKMVAGRIILAIVILAFVFYWILR